MTTAAIIVLMMICHSLLSVLKHRQSLTFRIRSKRSSIELVSSEMLMFEVTQCPIEQRRDMIREYIELNSSVHVGPGSSEKVREMARVIMATGVKYKDACHVASAIIAECDYFISTDKRLLKYKSDVIRIVNPIEFISEMEGEL